MTPGIGSELRDDVPPELRADIRERSSRFRSRLGTLGVDVAIVLEPENIRYLTGFESLGYFTPMAALLRADGKDAIFCRHSEASNVLVTAVDCVPVGYADDADVVEELARVIPRGARVGWDLGLSGWTARDLLRLGTRLGLEPADIGQEAYALRMVKSAVELDLLRRAAVRTRAAVDAAILAARQATLEREVAAAAYRAMVLAGAAYPSSPVYVVSGPRSAQAHVTWQPERRLSRDVLFLEVGASVERYTAPLMSTGLGVDAGDRLRWLTDRLEPWLQAVIGAVRPGVSAASVELQARAEAQRLGVADAVRHRIGYSVGTSFPQGWGEPHILALKASESRELVPGMVLHLVPHLVDEAFGGVGLSATVAVGTEGCEVITYPTGGPFEY